MFIGSIEDRSGPSSSARPGELSISVGAFDLTCLVCQGDGPLFGNLAGKIGVANRRDHAVITGRAGVKDGDREDFIAGGLEDDGPILGPCLDVRVLNGDPQIGAKQGGRQGRPNKTFD